ncbi:MAG: NAD-dependent epimerase/dehydratase family protein [Solirubrobacteraceae bacterium]
MPSPFGEHITHRARETDTQPDQENLNMRVFVAGATGAIGAQLVPQLLAAGHTVAGMTRSEGKSERLR